jgi:AraC-like DNA-binding protein
VSEVAAESASSNIDNLGCPLGKLTDDQHIVGSSIKFYRKGSESASLGQVVTPGANRGYLLGLSLRGGHTRRIFNQHHSTLQSFDENSVYLRNFADPYKADLSGPFEFALLEITNAALAQIADGAEMRGVSELKPISADADPVLGGLLGALFSSVGGKRERSALFVDQLSTAIGVHVVHQYGNGRLTISDRRRTLSRRSELQIKELMKSRLSGDVSVDQLAAECNMARATFLRAFRETTGRTPHQWLMQQRVEKACELLSSSELSLAEVSLACGFADQSHFTRVFSAELGATPGLWRRSRKS